MSSEPAPVRTGTVVAIEPQGTIVIVWVNQDEPTGPQPTPVFFDHTPFRWMFEARGGRVIGEKVEIWDCGEGEQLAFVDDPETEILQHNYKPGAHDGLAF